MPITNGPAPTALINTGLTVSPPRPKDYVAGAITALPSDVVLPGGDWRPYKSDPHEMQLRFGRDFLACTNFAATDTVEALMNKIFGENENYSDRALAIMSGLTRTGNSLFNVAEAIRTKGLVPEAMFPWTAKQDTFEKFTGWTADEEELCLAYGREWLRTYDFGWEWVYDDYGRGMRYALERSPIFAAGLYAAEASKVNGVYTTELPNSLLTTHAFVLLNQFYDGFKDIDDSYAVQVKRLAPDFRVPVGMRFWIQEKPSPNPMPNYYPPKNSYVSVADTGERLLYVGGEKIIKFKTNGDAFAEAAKRGAKDGMIVPFPAVDVHAADIAHLQRVDPSGDPL